MGTSPQRDIPMNRAELMRLAAHDIVRFVTTSDGLIFAICAPDCGQCLEDHL